MYSYIPLNEKNEKDMLEAVGVSETEDLFSHIPEELILKNKLNLGQGMSESELTSHMKAMADKNKTIDEQISFLGAGAYDRFIPSIISHLVSRSEFYTAYTPYQPEISQGTLQAIFEFQSMIAELTGMDVANASMYDGASACAEAALMAAKHTKNKKILISSTVHPETKEVVKTYASFNQIEVKEIEESNGVTDKEILSSAMGDDIGGVIIQSPNFYGQIEDLESLAEIIHSGKKTLMITSISDPLSYVFLKSPGQCGSDVVVGEGQSFGLKLNLGGPYLGFMAATEKLMRKMPGRIVGETTDVDGNRAFVLTLQAREQHIRREKATSNICSNQGLNALMATIYMSVLGKGGLTRAAQMCINNTQYAIKKLSEIGITPVYDGPCFEEFVVDLGTDSQIVCDKLAEEGVLCGFPVDKSKLLICVSEKRTKDQIDSLVDALERAVK